MTHRPIEPIELSNGLKPGGTPRAFPIFENVDPRSLLVDDGYQRDTAERSLKLVRKIVANWDWARFKPPVAVLTDAGIELIDGQHTAIAAASHPDIDLIPVMIVEAPQRPDRAGAFIGHNRDRVQVTTAQIHVASVLSGDADAIAVNTACEAAGVRVLRGNKDEYQAGDTLAITAIGAVIKARGVEHATTVLRALAEGGLAPITQLDVKAADLLLSDPEYGGQITAASLAATVKAMGDKARKEAQVFRAAHPSVPLWKALAVVWFKNRRGRANLHPASDLKTKSGKLIENIIHRPRVAPDKPAEPAPTKRDSRPALGGWKPGPFLRRCSGCEESYEGDKRSSQCADCAYGCTETPGKRVA